MNKALFAVVLLTAFFSGPLFAQGQPEAQGQIIDQYTTIESTGETLVHRTLSLMNPATHQMELMTQVLRKSKDGTLTLVPLMMSDNLKRRHELLWEQQGGTDVTGEGVSTMSASAIDAFQCDMSPGETATDEGNAG